MRAWGWSRRKTPKMPASRNDEKKRKGSVEKVEEDSEDRNGYPFQPHWIWLHFCAKFC